MKSEQVGERIKQERQRIGLNQTDFAKAADASKNTVIQWEKGATSPTAVQLSALSDVGVDVLYILTGQRAAVHAQALSPQETAVLSHYRALSEPDKASVNRLTDALAQSTTHKSGNGG